MHKPKIFTEGNSKFVKLKVYFEHEFEINVDDYDEDEIDVETIWDEFEEQNSLKSLGELLYDYCGTDDIIFEEND